MKILLLTLIALSTVASAQSLEAKGRFKEAALNTLTSKFGELKAVDKCGFYRGQWAVAGKWDDSKVGLYSASAYQRFEGEISHAELVTVKTEELAKAITTLAPENEAEVAADLATLAAEAVSALKDKKVLVSAGRISSSSTAVNVVVFSNKKTKEFLSLGVRPTCSK